MQPENNSAGAKIVTALIIGLIIGFGAGAFWQERRLSNDALQDETAFSNKDAESVAASKESATKQMAAVEASETKGEGERPTPSGNAAILVEDQAAGDFVTVGQVVTDAPVWVAVREERNNGLGNILGVTKIAAGTHAPVLIELLRPTVAGQRYFTVLHRDVGDAAFNYREDVLIEGVQGGFTAK